MVRSTSPLRYPGGKTSLHDLIAIILRTNTLERTHYVEPFAGGGGLALSLLYEGFVSDIHLNDVDAGIASFWDCALNRTDDFVYRIEKTPVTIDEWHIQREIYLGQDSGNSLALGFATFFLNRTNRSGVIKGAGPIGGLKQDGNYKIDCRFNRPELARRVRRISKYKSRIHFHRRDALQFIDSMARSLPTNAFFCIDPPYFNKGSSLYTSFYNPSDHAVLARSIVGIKQPWIVTYDNAPEISAIYSENRQFNFDINYSLETKRIGTELLIASSELRIPHPICERPANHDRSPPIMDEGSIVAHPIKQTGISSLLREPLLAF